MKLIIYFLVHTSVFSTVIMKQDRNVRIDHFKIQNENKYIVIRDYGDSGVLLHEIGHYMMSEFGVTKELRESILEQNINYSPLFYPSGDSRFLRDIYSALSRGRENTRSGHSEQYFSSDHNVVGEMYANLYVIWVRNQYNHQDHIKEKFPRIYKEWTKYWNKYFGERNLRGR